MSSLEVVNEHFKNIVSFEREYVQISHPMVTDIVNKISGCNRYLATVKDDETAGYLGFKLWTLRQSIVLAIVPFNSPCLFLSEQFNVIQRESINFLRIHDEIDSIGILIENLLENFDNPKAQKVYEYLSDFSLESDSLGLVSSLAKFSTAGWSDEVRLELKEKAENCVVIRNSKILSSAIYDYILVPSGGAKSPLIYSLYYGGYAKKIIFVMYDFEHAEIPSRRRLPDGACNILGKVQSINNEIVSSQDNVIEEIHEDILRNMLRPDTGIHSGFSVDQQFIVNAWFLVLVGNKTVYLEDKSKIIEISDIVDHRVSVNNIGSKFPRKAPNSIKAGDVIVLRTSGSGEYLIDVVNDLLLRDGLEHIRQQALDWKEALGVALENKGTKGIYDRLERKGLILKSGHGYLWYWSTNKNIGPDTKEKFRLLIEVLKHLDLIDTGGDLNSYINSRWKNMTILKSYHQKAGSYIRKLLLKELKGILQNKEDMDDVFEISLLGSESGNLMAYRVLDIAPETTPVAFTTVGLLKDIG